MRGAHATYAFSKMCASRNVRNGAAAHITRAGGHTGLKIWYNLCIIRQYISKTAETMYYSLQCMPQSLNNRGAQQKHNSNSLLNLISFL